MDDQHFMQMAIDLAWRGLYTTAPNPRVGCVLVSDDRVIGQGWHQRAGEGHAEVNAIDDVADADKTLLKEATAYVTLEPCSHTGKTPPCCEALIAAGVKRVVAAMEDPNPLVAGNGFNQLREAGIEVECGVLEEQARTLNPGFIKRMQTGLPWLRAKLAMSLDGRTAMASGESQWITGKAAREDVQRLRARSCAVISGVDTVITDQASLTVRPDELGLDLEQAQQIAQRQPLRVILDSQLRLPPTSRLLSLPGKVIVVTAKDDESAQCSLEQAGAEVLVLAGSDGKVDLSALVQWLASQDCNEVLLEAGATLAGALLKAGLIDHLTIYMAPKLLGSHARPLFQLPLDTMAQQQRLQIDSIEQVGEDWRIDCRPGQP